MKAYIIDKPHAQPAIQVLYGIKPLLCPVLYLPGKAVVEFNFGPPGGMSLVDRPTSFSDGQTVLEAMGKGFSGEPPQNESGFEFDLASLATEIDLTANEVKRIVSTGKKHNESYNSFLQTSYNLLLEKRVTEET